MVNNFRIKEALVLLVVFHFGASASTFAQEKTDNERRGLFQRIFTKDKQIKNPGPGYTETVHGVFMDRESDTIAARVNAEPEPVASSRTNDGVNRYPEIPGYQTIRNSSQKKIEKLIEEIYKAYEQRIRQMDPPDLRTSGYGGNSARLADAAWISGVGQSIWPNQRDVRHSVDDIYIRTLEYSNQVKVFRDLPLIRETGMQEADGEFDVDAFIDARLTRTNEPIGSTLTTGNNANRFLENRDYIEGGFRKKFATGAEATLSNRFSTLSNNSSFLIPQNQGASEMVLSVVQPLLDGGGYHYNQSKIKIAKFDSRMASAEFVRQLQSHLVEVNRSYWALYYARSYYLLNRSLVSETQGILGRLEERSDLDALQSEVLRARASLANRKSVLSRAEMAVRNSEERLRALVNDPDQDIGSNAETIPASRPVLSFHGDDVREVTIDALRNRPEVSQGFDQLRSAIIRRDMQKNEKWPTLNLVAEMMLGDIDPNDDVSRAFGDQWEAGTGYSLGFQFEQSVDNDVARARLLRREVELRQQANQLKATIDTIILEAVVSYREVVTAYRDMQGRYDALRAAREELRQLRERLDVDTEDEGGRTTASQLQLILDSMERRQSAEEAYLDAVVIYNSSFAALDRARGTLLNTEGIKIERVRDTDLTHPRHEVERLQITKSANTGGPKNGKSYYPAAVDLPSSDDGIAEPPPFARNESDAPEAIEIAAAGTSTPASATLATPVASAPVSAEKKRKNFFSMLKKKQSSQNAPAPALAQPASYAAAPVSEPVTAAAPVVSQPVPASSVTPSVQVRSLGLSQEEPASAVVAQTAPPVQRAAPTAPDVSVPPVPTAGVKITKEMSARVSLPSVSARPVGQ